ncbi:MAG: PD-(D/E)XK nuclease family protein, partial [Epsilonproteobacteria bacterium]
IYPTSRALRTVSAKQKEEEGFLPALMRMDEFEQRAILLEDRVQIDPLQRILLLREAASFEAFENLKLNIELVKFFTKSDALFKFFEELAAEQISFDMLAQADAYAEFEMHLGILEQLFENYRKLLELQGFTDKAFIPSTYRMNEGFLQSYESIEIHLEGYLSHFELELIEKIAKRTELIIHYTTSTFNVKMQERFEALGITLPNHAHVSFNFTEKKILTTQTYVTKINANVFSVEEREEQIAVAFAKLEEMVQSGIPPEEIVLILPDENFKEHFTLFDAHNNLNFAMGYDYANGRIYKSLEALYKYWQSFDTEYKTLLERYGFDLETVEKLSPLKRCNIELFFSAIDGLGLLECPLLGGEKKEKINERVYEKYLHLMKLFVNEELSLKEWLFIWLKALSKITIDDVRGGMITVMGVLETRGVSFEGVVIVDFNEGIVPATSSKDQFLNSAVRAFANLPTKNDRESLQKQYYKRLMEQAKEVTILYSTSDNKLPSKFLYELGLSKAKQTQAQFDLLYAQPSQLHVVKDPLVEQFNAEEITWSASRLKTYLECKRKYFYRYIQKIEAKEDDELNEGSFLHTLLERIHEKDDHYSSSSALELAIHKQLDALLPFDDAKTAYRKLLWKEKLKGYIERQTVHFQQEWRVIHREKEFRAKIGGLDFKGRIDRIDQNATDTLVLDYKSGNVEKEPKKLNPEKITDFQMSIYQQLLSGKYQNISLAFLRILDGGEMQEVTLLEERNTLLEEHIATLKQTKSFVAEKCEDLQKCKWCEFTLMCGRGEYL